MKASYSEQNSPYIHQPVLSIYHLNLLTYLSRCLPNFHSIYLSPAPLSTYLSECKEPVSLPMQE